MSPQSLILSIVTCAVCFASSGAALGAEPTTVALTMTKPAETVKDQQLAENLLTLVELAVQSDKSLAVIERRQIDLVIQELVLNQSRPADAQLQLGKLITADFLVMLEILAPDKDSKTPWGRLRMVDPKTGAIRGVTVASVDEATLEETAEQFARYVSALIRAPERPTVTVAVVPFESKGRFDRLRPLELGIRDLVTTRLLELSGAAPAGPAEARQMQAALEPLRFQVLQRSNMEQLLRELDLIQSGLSDKSRLPETLPARGAAYLVRGEIDERQVDDKYTIIVRGEMIRAANQQVADTFQFECKPKDLAEQLAAAVDRIGERLWKDEKIAEPAHVKATFEVESLRQLALADVRRFRRTDPRTGEQPFFHLPGQQTHGEVARGVEVRTLLGRHLLHKSIDRLESILFMTRDDAEAAYALGFCYSINEPDIYAPERADEMLRKAYALGRGTELEALALDYLAQIDFEDQNGNGQLIEGREAQAIEHIWFVFVNMPEKYRGREWLFLRSLGRLHKRPEQNQALADLLIKAVPFAEGAPPARRKMMGMAMQDIAMQLVRQAGNQPELKAKGLDLLKRWAEGEDKELAYWGRKGLTELAADTQDFAGAAAANEAAAALIVDLTSQEERDRRDELLIEAAKLYREGGDPKRALKLLESFDVPVPPDSATRWHKDLPGSRQFEIGCCYEALKQPDKALASFLHATQINPTVAGRHEVIQHIEGLGGVPLDKDRDVDVKYLPSRPGELRGNVSNMHLAAVGQKIYAGDQQGVRVFDVASQSWAPTSFPGLAVTCIKSGNGQLFAGTQSDGLWQCDVSTGKWRRVCPLDQLPDPHVESLALDGRDVYLGVGTKASGGLVRIDGDGNLHVFNERGAPAVAPTHIVLAKHRVLVGTAEAVYEWSMIDEAWFQKEPGNHRHYFRPQLFAGSSAIWMSQRGRELGKWQATDEENARFSPAWYIPANNTGYVMGIGKPGYHVYFFAQRGDEVWYGGEQWLPFVNSGLYRFNLKTGEFHRFSPADGFRPLFRHSVYDGLWLNDRLWLATAAGLCVVAPVGTLTVTPDSRPADAKPVAGESVPSKPVADGRDGSMAPRRTASAGKARDEEADAPAAEAGGSELAMTVTLEAGAHDPLNFVLKDTYSRPLKTWDNVAAGEVRLRLPKLENGRYWLEITANGYALQRFSFEVTRQGIQVAQNRVELYRRRYVVLRYAVNKVGERDLTGPDVKEGRVAISVASVPDLHGDWSIQQVKASPTFRFHRMAEGYGFASPPAGASFDKIDLAPHPDQYTYGSVEPKKGMVLLSRIEGNGPADLRYAKILVEDVTETPPKDIQVIDSPLPPARFAQPAAKRKVPAMDESSGQLAVGVRLEDGAHSPVSFELRDRSGKTFKAWDPQEPGDLQLSLPGLLHDGYVLIASAKGYGPVGLPIKVSAAGVEPTTAKIALYRVRYLVVRYAMNSAGERELTGANVKEGRVAITVGSIPELRDWDVQQSDGQVKAIVRRRYGNAGFALAPEGSSYDKLGTAPEEYGLFEFPFEKNMILFNHVVGHRPHDARYAKLMVEDITETRPKDLEIIDNSRRK